MPVGTKAASVPEAGAAHSGSKEQRVGRTSSLETTTAPTQLEATRFISSSFAWAQRSYQ